METQSGRGWLVNAFSIFLFVLSLWILVALWAGNTYGATFPLLADLRSHIFADYGSDAFGRTLKALQLTILGDINGGFPFGDGSNADWNLSFQDPVPTATQHGTQGSTEVIDSPTEEPELPTHTATEDDLPTHTPEPGTPTQTPKPTKTPEPTSTSAPQPVRPILECVRDNHDGNYTAFFGYKNPNSFPLKINIGMNNHFSPDPGDRGQSTWFEPGRKNSYPDAAFSVLFDGNEITWHLGSKAATASSGSEPCDPPDPEPTPKHDIDAPILSGGILHPPPGVLTMCESEIQITDLEVVDHPWSSGIEWVKLKYLVEGYSNYVYSPALTLKTGGPTPEGGWNGCYSGEVSVEIDPGWESPEPDMYIVNVWVKARDYAGLEGYLWLGEYYVPASCGGNDE